MRFVCPACHPVSLDVEQDERIPFFHGRDLDKLFESVRDKLDGMKYDMAALKAAASDEDVLKNLESKLLLPDGDWAKLKAAIKSLAITYSKPVRAP